MSIRSSRPLAAALLALSLATGVGAQSSADSVRAARLAALGRLWGAVKYFHPAVAAGRIDWDSALVAAIPGVRTATSKVEYAAAVDAMLRSLGDPATRVMPAATPEVAAPSAPATTRWAEDSTLVIVIPDPTDWNSTIETLNGARADFEAAPRLIFDLRTGGVEREAGVMDYILGVATVGRLLSPTPIAAPAVRSRVYSGFEPQVFSSSGGYWSGFVIRSGSLWQPASSAVRPRRIGFIVDEHSDLPLAALALQQAGTAVIAAQGQMPNVAATATSWTTTLVDSVQVTVRVGELVTANGTVEIRPDTVVSASAAGAGDAALAAALALVRAPARPRAPTPSSPEAAPPPAERPYADMHYPPLEYRLLAAFRYWTAIEYFFPYKHLTREDWNQVLVSMIPRFEAAADSVEYVLAIAELVSKIHDSHGFIGSAVLFAYLGQVPSPVKIRYVEGLPVVTEVSADASVQSSGIRPGDVVLAVDGETTAARRARLEPYLASSTPQALDWKVADFLLSGSEGSTATLRVRDAEGREREVRLPRRAALFRPSYLPVFGDGDPMRWMRPGPTWEVLPGNIGYVDLEKLTVAQVDSMFDALRDTRAIIFDNRSYPQGTAWAIAPRLTEQREVAAARFQRPLAFSPDTLERSVHSFVQTLPGTTKWRYLNPTVMLVDERTISQAEHTGLFFEAANGTKFIGSPTVGANGDQTFVLLPGNIPAAFTGHDVRHADGRQLQRVGLQPHVLVLPTIAGIRAGKDEVLERAVRYIETGR
jgi:C-terminal processing protease CtpA/Prc